MEQLEVIVVAGIVLSLFLALISFILAKRMGDNIKKFNKQIGNLISPQREYMENKIYNTSNLLVKNPAFLEDTNRLLITPESNKDMIIKTNLPDFSFYEDLGIRLPEIQIDKNMAMCLMPFNRRFDKTKGYISEACQKAGYKFCRSDDELLADNTDLRKSIVRMILEAEVVIAVLDGRNPNVFYEIGIAHSAGKLVLMVANLNREENQWQEVDLLSNRLITYNNPTELKDKLVKTLEAIHADGSK